MDSSPTVSFDVFDTILTRFWFRPDDVFRHMGLAMADLGLSPDDWLRIRKTAEAGLRKDPKCQEVTLDEIYRSVQVKLGWSDEICSRIRALELEYELRAIRPIASMTNRHNVYIQARKRVIYVSDFYQGRDFIKTILAAININAAPESIYVSCDYRQSKRYGGLFKIVTEELGNEATWTLHIGDHPESDVSMAQKHGLEVSHFEESAATLREHRLASGEGLDVREHLRRSAVAGAARRARLSLSPQSDREKVIHQVATSVAGPLLFSYTFWVLMEAKKRGIDRLYFLARDGQILLEVARKINKLLGLDIDLHYTYASRQAWFFPSLREITRESLGWMFDVREAPTSREILERLGFKNVSSLKIDVEDIDTKFQSKEALDQFLDILASEPFRSQTEAQLNEHSRLAVHYLDEVGMCDPKVRWGVVDVGWKGRLQVALKGVLDKAGSSVMPVGFYIALIRAPMPDTGEYVTFFSTQKEREMLNASMIELFCAADHGSVKGYARNDSDGVSPVLALPDVEALDWGVMAQQEAILSFSDAMVDAMENYPCADDEWLRTLKDASTTSLREFYSQPRRDEAEVYGEFLHSVDLAHSIQEELAPRVPKHHLLAALIAPRLLSRASLWSEGSIARSLPYSAAQLYHLLFSLRLSLSKFARRLTTRVARES